MEIQPSTSKKRSFKEVAAINAEDTSDDEIVEDGDYYDDVVDDETSSSKDELQTSDENEDVDDDEDVDDFKMSNKPSSRKKRHIIIPTNKLNVIHTNSPAVAQCVDVKDGMLIVNFLNYAVSVPYVEGSGIDLDISPAPAFDPTEISICEHNYIRENTKTRSGDEIFTVLYVCSKCKHIKQTS